MLEVSEAEPVVGNDEIVIPIPVVEADEQEMVIGKVPEDTEIDTETDIDIEVSEMGDNFVSREFDECFRSERVNAISDEKNDIVQETVYGKKNAESVSVNIGEYEEIRWNELSVASPISL